MSQQVQKGQSAMSKTASFRIGDRVRHHLTGHDNLALGDRVVAINNGKRGTVRQIDIWVTWDGERLPSSLRGIEFQKEAKWAERKD